MSLDDIEDRLDRLTGANVVPLPQKSKKDAMPIVVEVQPAKPHGWRFVPERGADNLIIEIIATPIPLDDDGEFDDDTRP